jgi:hypothetical protein
VFALFDRAFIRLAGKGTWQYALELGVGAVLVAVGSILGFDLRGGRWLLLERLLERAAARGRGPAGLLGAVGWRLRGGIFAVLGLAFLGLGVLELVRGATGLI